MPEPKPESETSPGPEASAEAGADPVVEPRLIRSVIDLEALAAPGISYAPVMAPEPWVALIVEGTSDREIASLAKLEVVFGGFALLFLYFSTASPPHAAFGPLDLIFLAAVVGSTAGAFWFYFQLELNARASLEKLFHAAKERTAAEPGKADEAHDEAKRGPAL
ncbi:MAG TPA: hypothetical protein VGB08_07020 [Allosphingosinicella sp.]|jgi:hypothetical protein